MSVLSDLLAEINALHPSSSSTPITRAQLVTVLGDVARREAPLEIRVDDFGAVGDFVADDTAAIQAAFDYVGSQDVCIPVNFTGGKWYRISDTIRLPSPSMQSAFYVRGNGCGLYSEYPITLMARIPADNAEADDIISKGFVNISGFSFCGIGIAGQVGLHIAAYYTPVVEHCYFSSLEYGSIGTFCLGGAWRDNKYADCFKRPFLLQTGHGYDSGPVWPDGAVGGSDSNGNVVENCRVFGFPGQAASYTIVGSDGCVLHGCISEGHGDSVDVRFDYQSSGVVKMFSIYDLHCEAPNQKVNLKLSASGAVTIHNLVRTYPAAILDAQGSNGAHFVFTGLSYLGNMPTTPWFYHSDGGGYGGTPRGISSSCAYSISESFPGMNSGGISTAANWENATFPNVLFIDNPQASDFGIQLWTNNVLSITPQHSYGILTTNLNSSSDDTSTIGAQQSFRSIHAGTGGFVSKNGSAIVGTTGTKLRAQLPDTSAAPLQGKITTDTNYAAGAPTATGYLTLYDATGTAYRVLVAT